MHTVWPRGLPRSALCLSPIALYDLITPDIVRTLLNHGATPNEQVEIVSWDGKTARVTCWEHALMWQHHTYKESATARIGGTTAETRKITESRLQMLNLLIERGSKARTEILTSTGERLTAKIALQESFGEWVGEENLRSVLELSDARSARQGIGRLLKHKQRHD